MDGLPTCIRFMSATLGKPVSAFTKADWERAAILAGNMADKFWDRLHPKPKKKGAPRKYSGLYILLKDQQRQPRKKAGRKSTTYHGLTAEEFGSIVGDLMSFSNGPRSEIEAIRLVERALKKYSGAPLYTSAIARALRRSRQKKRTQLKK